MSILKRYSIKYESDSQRESILLNLKTNIEKIYQNLGDFYKALKYRKKTLKIRI